LHLQQHHGKLGAAGFGAASGWARPQNPIEAVAELFDFKSFKAVEPIAGGAGVEAQRVVGGG
jgi:hypothetical protein